MTKQTWEIERDEKRLERSEWVLERILLLLEEILRRLPPPPKYQPSIAIVVVPTGND